MSLSVGRDNVAALRSELNERGILVTNAVERAMAARQKTSVDEGRLEKIREKVRRARDIEFELVDLQGKLSELNKELQELQHKTIPDMMDEVGIDKLGLQPEGNYPAYDINIKPYYAANIAASWPVEKRSVAFKYLEQIGHGDLIKTDVVTKFPRGKHKKALALLERLAKQGAKQGFEVDLKESVSHQTLTAWLREQVEQQQTMPKLDLIGGTVGRIAQLKARKS